MITAKLEINSHCTKVKHVRQWLADIDKFMIGDEEYISPVHLVVDFYDSDPTPVECGNHMDATRGYPVDAIIQLHECGEA